MSLNDVMGGLVKEKKEKAEGKHYIPFSNKEWADLETKAGRELEPKDVKALITAIFNGELKVSK